MRRQTPSPTTSDFRGTDICRLSPVRVSVPGLWGRVAPDCWPRRPAPLRGRHDRPGGVVKNMPAGARAAISGNFAIECDIQLTADGEAIVHHDDTLGRLTEGSGALLDKSAAELRALKFKDTSERMMSLGDLCELINGRVPLVIEVKSHFDGDRKLVKRMAEVLA